jgi:hypothetical protein
MFGDIEVGCKRTSAEGAEVDADDTMLARSQVLGNAGCSFKLYAVTLAIIERQSVTFKSVFSRQG